MNESDIKGRMESSSLRDGHDGLIAPVYVFQQPKGWLVLQHNLKAVTNENLLILQVQLAQARQSQSRLWATNWAALCLYSIVMRPLTSRPWVESLLVSARLVPTLGEFCINL